MKEKLKKYAELAIRVGVNLQPGQNLVIGYGIRQVLPEHIELARLLVAAGYDAGAKFVQVDWGDEWWHRETVRRGSLQMLEARAQWQAQWVERLAEDGAAFVAIPASDPNLYAGVDSERVAQASRMIDAAFRPFNDRRTDDTYSWTLVSAPTQEWANKVYSELPEQQRVAALWKGILASARADGDDPVAQWQEHLHDLQKRSAWMNGMDIHKLHYTAPGTDLWVELQPEHYWCSAEHRTPQGVLFVANIPTEEVYSAPMKTGINGIVSSTMPLNHRGALIDGIQLRLERGRIVEYTAQEGLEALRSIIETDEGSHYLGEVALVPVDSPIAMGGRLFYNTLFDENASCHLAIGKAYPLVHVDHELTRADWAKYGLNESLVHVDFMIGSDQLNIDATMRSGTVVSIMRAGKFVE